VTHAVKTCLDTLELQMRASGQLHQVAESALFLETTEARGPHINRSAEQLFETIVTVLETVSAAARDRSSSMRSALYLYGFGEARVHLHNSHHAFERILMAASQVSITSFNIRYSLILNKALCIDRFDGIQRKCDARTRTR
jgi:hypothetical protein